MSGAVIRAKGLAKTYLMYPTPRHRLWQMVFGRWHRFYEPFEALKPVSFGIQPGETVGIVGRNGSGKSTLLQMLAGTLNPTAGEVAVNGKVAALLELGAGFNPEFTGRENVYLNGAILGMRQEEIDSAYEEIAAFANIGAFIDRPVSTYSSGMVVRLAFSVATASRPDVLIVDEALSVGDEAFQRKCFARIEKMREAGTTVLFVSHSAQTVIQLCDRAIWLDRGELRMDDVPKKVIDAYHIALHAKQAAIAQEQPVVAEEGALIQVSESMQEYPSDGGRIQDPRLTDVDGRPVSALEHGKRYRFSYRVMMEIAAENVRAGMLLKTRTGVEVAGAVLHLKEHGRACMAVGESVECVFEFTSLLYPGSYFLNCGVMGEVDGEERYLHRLVDVFELKLTNPTGRNDGRVSPEGLVDIGFIGNLAS